MDLALGSAHETLAGSRTARGGLAALLLSAIGATMVIAGFPAAFKGFGAYDDEGFYLVQLRDAAARVGPYAHVYSAYGPAYNLFGATITSVTRLPLDHDGGRILALVLWAATAAAAGVFVWRHTTSLALGAMTVPIGFLWLGAALNEPGQPATFAFLLTLALLCITERPHAWKGLNAALIGALCMALLLVKINLGIYAVAAVGFSIATTTGRRRWLRLLVFTASVALPVMILRHGLAQHDTKVLLYLVIVELGVVSLIVRTYGGQQRVAVDWLPLALGGTVTLVVLLLGSVYQGDNIGAVVRAVVINPFRYVSSGTLYEVDMTGVAIASVVAFAAMVLVLINEWPWFRMTLRALVLPTVFIPLLYNSGGLLPLRSPMVEWAVVPILLLGDDESNSSRGVGRLCLAALIVFNELQAYPVPGSQVAFATFLTVPAAFIVTRDLIVEVRMLGRTRRVARFASSLALTGAAALVAVLVIQSATRQWSTYSRNVPLHLVGSDLMHLPPLQVDYLEATVNDVRSRSCTSLVTYPGMLSFYAWTGLPAPPGLVLADGINWRLPGNRGPTEKYLRLAPNTCLIRNASVQRFWTQIQAIPRWPELEHLLTAGYTRNTEYGNYVVSQTTH